MKHEKMVSNKQKNMFRPIKDSRPPISKMTNLPWPVHIEKIDENGLSDIFLSYNDIFDMN